MFQLKPPTHKGWQSMKMEEELTCEVRNGICLIVVTILGRPPLPLTVSDVLS